MTALTTDCRALLAACRAQPDEDTPRLELADALDALDTVSVKCTRCKGKGQYSYNGAEFGYTVENCPDCGGTDEKRGTGFVPDTSARDRAELIRVQVEIARLKRVGDPQCTWTSAGWCPVCGDCTCANREESMSDAGCPLHDPVNSTHDQLGHATYLESAESALTSANPDWLPPCPSCGGERVVPTINDDGDPDERGCECFSGRIGTHVRGLTALTVPTLRTIFHRPDVTCPACDGKSDWSKHDVPDDAPGCGECGNHGVVEGPWQLTPYARELRDRFPFVSEVWVGDRVPQKYIDWDGKESHYWFNGDVQQNLIGEHDLPGIVWRLLDGFTDSEPNMKFYPTPDLASRALAAAVARVVYDGARSDNGVSLTGL